MPSRIKKVSYLFQWVFQITFIILPILYIIAWIYAPLPFDLLTPLATKLTLRAIPPSIEVLQLDFFTRLSGFLISAIPLAAMEFLLYFLIRLFQLYTRGEIFSLQNVIYIKKAGYALLIAQLLKPVCEGLLTGVLTWHNPPGLGLRKIVISFGSSDMVMLLTALLIILISWIMAEGYKMREEQQLTI